MKPRNALSPLLLNFAQAYGIKKVEVTKMELDMNYNHQVLTDADDANIRTTERNAYV